MSKKRGGQTIVRPRQSEGRGKSAAAPVSVAPPAPASGQGNTGGTSRWAAEQWSPLEELAAAELAQAHERELLGEIDGSLEACEDALTLNPASPALRFSIAVQLRALGALNRSVELLERIVEGPDPAPMMAYSELFRTMLMLGRAGDAADRCRRAIAKEGENGELLCALGVALRLQGRLGAAISTLERAIRYPDAPPAAHGELALALMAHGKFASAVTAHATSLYRCGLPMRGRHLGVLTTRSIPAWCKSHGARLQEVMPAGIGPTFRPRYEVPPSVCEQVSMSHPAVYLAEMEEASVIGGACAILTSDDCGLADPVFWQGSERLDLVEPAMPYVDQKGMLIDADSIAPEEIPVGVMMMGFADVNYYHWLVDLLSRIWTLERAEVDPRIPLLVDRRTMEIAQLASALRAVDRSARPVVALEPNVEYKVQRLLVPGSLSWLAPNLRDRLPLALGDSLISREAIDFLRERLGTHGGRPGTRRLYIARRAATTGARLCNPGEVGEVFRAAGFETVSPDGLSFEEQQSLFGEAAVVAGESGAGLTNMLLAPPSALLICLQAQAWDTNVYADLTGHAGQAAVFVPGRVLGELPPKPYMARFKTPPEELRDLLARALPPG